MCVTNVKSINDIVFVSPISQLQKWKTQNKDENVYLKINTLLWQTIVCKTISYLLFHYSYLNAPINTEEILGINTEKLLAYFVIIHDINISN
jgi:hypothetical protein